MGYAVVLSINMTTYNIATFHSMKHKNPNVWISWWHHDKENSFLNAPFLNNFINCWLFMRGIPDH